MPYRGVFREGCKRGSGRQGPVGNELLHHSFQAYEVWSVLQQVFPDGADLPARDPACADQEQACVMKETCTASLCIASRWSATRWYHQPTKARQPPTTCNGCGRWQGGAAATGGCNGAELFSGKYNRRPGFRRTKFGTFSAETPLPLLQPQKKDPLPGRPFLSFSFE